VVAPVSDLNPGHWAERYAASGLDVLPLHSVRDGRCTCRRECGRNAGKHPITEHGKDDATCDPGVIAGWWARWPGANVGIRPPAGVIVLDVDPRNGGGTSLLALTREHGQLPTTLTARTGSGGYHIWLSYGGRTRGQLCRGVDVKSHAGYVVAPPSMHGSGRRYEWLAVLPTAPAPRWVRQLLDPPPVALPSRPRPASGERQLDGLLRHIAEDPGGELNARLYWSSCRAHESGLNVEPLVALAVEMGHPERGARNTAASAAKAPPRRLGAAR